MGPLLKKRVCFQVIHLSRISLDIHFPTRAEILIHDISFVTITNTGKMEIFFFKTKTKTGLVFIGMDN